jgi:hypothetical protein
MTPEEERSLRVAIAALERLSRFSSEHGRPMLASLIEIARAEAEDELKTELESGKRLLEFKAGAVGTSLEADLQAEIAQLKRA